MTTPIEKSRDVLTRTFIESVRENGGSTPVEADRRVNTASRRVVQAFVDHYGSAWVGKFNRYDSDTGPVTWEINPATPEPIVYNFGADFVVPSHDDELDRLLTAYQTADWSKGGIAAKLDDCLDRIDELNGTLLHWS